ncbi:CHAT domain-containing protein [Microbacterium sp. SD291]|uniref:CHAT domain-containing protein n=1 Tax=Microbacterium sp. SD291 TaxID=2782007 RepID=UPI001A97810D|nr:CHAT domain-containing protein [Microbacterium sp. SD291]MBO0980781.1 CHAT domain-containing protein [Microbacterium sp. SD291]
MKLSAAELHRQGRAHLNAGRNAAARRVLKLAAERTDDQDLRARIAGSLAALTIRQGDPEAAEQLCREALALPGVSDGTAAIVYGQLGLLALERGALDEAVTLLDRGITGIGEEAEYRAPMLVNRSVAHSQAGRLAAARADVEAAADDYRTVGGEVERAMAMHNAGYIALLEGDLIAALDTMGEARGALAAASAVNAAICDLDRAEVLRDAGLAREAERSLERVVAVFGANRMRQAKGEAQFHLARSLLTHTPAKAVAAASAAARTFRAVGSDWWALRADGLRLRARLIAERDVPGGGRRSASPGTEADAVADALHREGLRAEAAALRLTGELALAGRGSAASAVIRTPRDAPLQVRLLAQEVRSARAGARGDESGARRHAAAGLDALAEWHRSFGSLDLATSLAMHGAGLVFAGLGSAVRSRRPDVVFDWSERARHLSQQTIPLRPPRDEALAADLAELRVLRSESGAGDWLSSPRAAELSERVRRRQWSSTGAAGTRDRISLDELRSSLTDGTALVSYIFDGAGLTALAVTQQHARVLDIGPWARVDSAFAGLRADLDVTASVRTGPLVPVVRDSLEERLIALSEALVEPVLATIGERSVAITVPGILGGIPWGMLPGMRGRAFTVANSASQWVAGRAGATAPGVGFVVGPRVARGTEEVTRAASAWRTATVLDRAAATVEATEALAARVGTLHVAAHGRHSSENPLFSGLELADGSLFGHDIDLIPNVPDTVVLSACELGRSSVRWGEEAVGMTRAWLHAGTRCVIASPVVVADDVACDLLAAMHERLAAGVSPAGSLALAAQETGIVAPFQAHGAGF